MRPDLRTFRVNGHCLIAACLEYSVTVLQSDARSIAYHVDFEANCDDHFFLSQDGGLMVAAFSSESFCCVEVVDMNNDPVVLPALREKATIQRLEGVYALDVRIALDRKTLLYWAHGRKSGTYACHIPSGQQQKIQKASFPTNGAWLENEVLLPHHNGKGGMRITYWPTTIRRVELSSTAVVWRLIEHPSMESILMLDADGQIASLRADTLEPQWRYNIPEAGWISYSGDGRYIAVRQHAPAGGRAERIVVLDSNSGELVRMIEVPLEQALFPLDGPRFLCYSGRFLNAETGEFEEGVSAPGFWEALRKRNGLCS